MALDDTLPKNLNASSNDKGPVGCTSLIINQPNSQVNQYNVYNTLIVLSHLLNSCIGNSKLKIHFCNSFIIF